MPPPPSIILFLPRPVLAQVRSVIVGKIAVNPLLPRKTLRSALWYWHIKTHTFTDVNAYVKKKEKTSRQMEVALAMTGLDKSELGQERA